MACLEAAIRRRALERALRAPVPTDEIDTLRATLERPDEQKWSPAAEPEAAPPSGTTNE
jgi:predicted RNA-binding protein YlxR (DUF448 family)